MLLRSSPYAYYIEYELYNFEDHIWNVLPIKFTLLYDKLHYTYQHVNLKKLGKTNWI